ncbi:MAG: DUF6938 domain-containing protein [Bacillota bacterium]
MYLFLYMSKINLVAADMGYGHQRAAYPLLALSKQGTINLNDYEGISQSERTYWANTLKSYEKISYFKKIPLLGSLVFKAMDHFQKIQPFYPKRPLGEQTFQQKMFLREIKKGLGKGLIERLGKESEVLPFVTTFFVAAYCAEYYNYPGDIYCIVCDADISRAWAPIEPKKSKIKYLAPNERVRERLKMYGVSSGNIFVTGFPLPEENIATLKADLAKRLVSLDPLEAFRSSFSPLLSGLDLPINAGRAFSLTFAVGGAGAQREIGGKILEKLAPAIRDGNMRLNLVAGSRGDVKEYFTSLANKESLVGNENLNILYHPKKMEYFRQFNECLRETDVLWTKPSELSFYSGLGLPILMSEPVGSQEEFNREWLLAIGAGMESDDPKFVNEWLLDWRRDGRLARAAMNAYLLAPHSGTESIAQIFNDDAL